MKYHQDGTLPAHGEVFVFGSNLAGNHGKGAALQARIAYGAVPGLASGFAGRSYAIPTKSATLKTLSLEVISTCVHKFLEFARSHPNLRFFVTRVGCGLAGLKDEQIASMFALAPENCSFAEEWKPFLEDVRVCEYQEN